MRRLMALALALPACSPQPAAPTAETAASARPNAGPETGGEASARPSSEQATAEGAAAAEGSSVDHAGLAAAVCPSGPYPRPIEGERQAEAIEGTAPTSLDPADTGFHLYEGPVWLDGNLYISDFRTTEGFPSRILRFTPEEGLSVALEDSGTNGLGLDASGQRLLGARHKSKSVVQFSSDLASLEELARQYQGKPFNSPNDLVMRSDGHLYFTDPNFQAGEKAHQQATNVYRVSPAGEVTVVDSSIKNPNGISISPDERILFVSGNLEAGYVKRYPIAEDGSVGDGEIVVPVVKVPDGMVLDCAGNLYVTEHTNRRIRVVTAEGEELGVIVGLDHNVTNVAFGGPQRNILYITMAGGLAKVAMPLAGLPY